MEDLSLDHQASLSKKWQQLCHTHNLQFAEYSFANNYLFRNLHSYKYVPHLLAVQGTFPDHTTFLIPTTMPQANRLQIPSQTLFPIPDTWLKLFEQDTFLITSDRADTDYVYSQNKLANLPGRHLSSRRNLLHQLEDHYQLESHPLSSDRLADATTVLEKWNEHAREHSDYLCCLEALSLMDRLNLFGRISYADHIPIGFTIGEQLTPSTTLLLLAKSLTDFKGSTPYIYEDFAQHVSDSTQWINLGQDLGLPTLRQAKLAYEPDLLLTKSRISLKI
ncbi:MAG: DUF2156 domain-containing protein [Parachlamydiaceae bacterium]|nr:DUF2156 domain-containing protein [Parachlamydiaceae bacterium]